MERIFENGKPKTVSLRRCLVALILGFLMLSAPVLAANKTPKASFPPLTPNPALYPENLPVDGQGFLDDAQRSAYVFEDPENGLWIYLTQTLSVRIERFKDRQKPLIWYETHLKLRAPERLLTVLSNEKRPGYDLINPEKMARRDKLVFAVSDDFFGDRISDRTMVGTVVRNGKIISDKTYPNSRKGVFPNLDVLALLNDGSILVDPCGEKKASEYLALGADNVLCFGPVLLRNGLLNEHLASYNAAREPRHCFGMIRPYEYVDIVVEGRHPKSEGSGLSWIAQRMQALGVREAINLDGGQTVALMFMGNKINTTGLLNKKRWIRPLDGLLAVGTSELVGD